MVADRPTTRVPDDTAVARIVAGAARIVVVDEDAAAEAMRLVFRTTHNVAEPAGALVAAVLTGHTPRLTGDIGVLCTAVSIL